MVKKPIFDTSVYSDYMTEIEEIYTSALFPTVVLYELMATSIDDSTLQKYDRWRVTLNKRDHKSYTNRLVGNLKSYQEALYNESRAADET